MEYYFNIVSMIKFNVYSHRFIAICEYFEADVNIVCVGAGRIRRLHSVLPWCRNQLRRWGSIFGEILSRVLTVRLSYSYCCIGNYVILALRLFHGC